MCERNEMMERFPFIPIEPSSQPVCPEGAHQVGAEVIKPRLAKWQEEHPNELVCLAHIGEPEGDPMSEVVRSLAAALESPDSFDYGEPQGYEPLREAIAGHLNRRSIYTEPVDAHHIILTPGSKMAGFMSARAILNPGEIAVVSELAYPGHFAGVKMNGGKLVAFRVDPENGYRHDPRQMAEVLEKYQPNLIWVCNPSNPSGLGYTPAEATPIIEYMESSRRAVLFQDIIYKDLTYTDGQDVVMFSAIPEIAGKVITNDGASKGPRFTGGRLGFIVVPRDQEALRQNLIDQANALYAGTPPLISRALIPAFSPEGDADIEAFRIGLQNKRDKVVSMINQIPGLRAYLPEGAFYVLVDVAGTRMAADEFFELSLEHGVGVLPVSYFGTTISDVEGDPLLRPEIAERTVRWSFGGPLEPQIAGLRRLYEVLSSEA